MPPARPGQPVQRGLFPGPSGVARDLLSSGAMYRRLLETFAQAWNAHDVDGLMACMVDDCVFETGGGALPCGSRFVGAEVVRARFRQVWLDVPDARFEGARHFVDGDRGCSEWMFVGTKATGECVETEGCDLFEFRDGKIAVKKTFLKQRRPAPTPTRGETMTAMLDSHDPATGELVGQVPITPVEGVPDVVAAARAAQPGWQATSPTERAAMLSRAGGRLVARADELGELLSREMGKALARGRGEVRSCGNSMAGKTDRVGAAIQPVTHDGDGTSTTIYYDGLGVCACISPWNYPMAMPHWMIVPALMAGNTVVLKPSEETPLIAQAYVDALNAELPPGVLSVVHGADEQGKALVDADVDLITFTGSRGAGVDIMRRAAGGLKRLVLELGGKDPLIVLEDADVDAAARFAVANSYDNSGQMCVSTERVLVHERIAEAFEARVTELAAEVTHGPWDTEGGVVVGPMINARQRDHVVGQIEEALASGARALVGGAEHPERYVLPTVLADVRDEMLIARDETFGPVVCISRFTEVDDAVASANAGPYGLGAVVFGADEERAYAVARRLDAGMIGVNKSIFGAGDTPWVGAKQSGFGYHGSPDGSRQFCQPRVVSRVRR